MSADTRAPRATRSPAAIAEIDLAAPEPSFSFIDMPPDAEATLVLARAGAVPVGILQLPTGPDELAPGDIARRLSTPPVAADAIGEKALAPASAGERFSTPFSVVVCTRDRPASLSRLLTTLDEQVHDRFEMIVVDNAPSDSRTRDVVAACTALDDVRYVVAPVPGLARARNAGIAAASHEWVAMVDDDELPDRWWLHSAAAAVARRDPDAVTGLMLPAQLRTDAQWWFELYGGHSKGRELREYVFGPGSADAYDPLFPLPPFGAGGNMIFRRSALARIGGFDETLGAGTPTLGAEDTLALSKVLLTGGTIVYDPAVFVWHYHRDDLPGLRRQFFGYGSGLSAFYTVLLLENPRLLPRLLGLTRRGLQALSDAGGERMSDVPADFPRDLLAAKNKGLVLGPWLALRSGARPGRRRPGG